MKGRSSVSKLVCGRRIASTFRLYNLKPTREDKVKLYELIPADADESETYSIIEGYIVETYHIK